MIIILSLLALTVFGIWLFSKDFEIAGPICAIVGAALLFAALICLIILRVEYRAKAAQLASFKETVANSRLEQLAAVERAAIVSDIAKWNEWLAETKYYNNTLFDIWIPDSVANIEFLK